ncbi:hypothetical protein F3Y22_tig00110082pilonHSYRG00027 [Hibiscus syriacus]|uniref:Uncharacterized protein n=1 Tax=Hibiscus syriacus TaxID=106335 RepID=A0A6A3BLM3_HIBSY|nr:hypothetical protein F3Y22_tig00110082pilonHSYRG00027 [Hibiscus syriacus]
MGPSHHHLEQSPPYNSCIEFKLWDLSYNSLNGSIPESLGQLTALRRLNLNGNSLSGRVPAALGGRLLNGDSFNFTDNAGLCGIPGLRTCGLHLSAGAKVGIVFFASLAFLLLVICSVCYWKRRQNILRAQQMAARGAPYAKARTQFSHDIQCQGITIIIITMTIRGQPPRMDLVCYRD